MDQVVEFLKTYYREYNGPVIIASPAGGMDIEDVAHKTPELIKTLPVDIFEGVTDAMANDLAEFLLFKGDLKKKAAQEIKHLWEMFLKVFKIQIFIQKTQTNNSCTIGRCSTSRNQSIRRNTSRASGKR